MPAALEVSRALKPEAELTAAKLNRFITEAHRLLIDHPVNLARVRRGMLPATGIITRGAGSHLDLDNKLVKQGLKTALVSGCNTVLGLGHIFGFDTINEDSFTADIDTDIDAKIAAVKVALNNHDMVYVHFKGPDVCSHDCQPLAKRDFLQRLDLALKPLLGMGVTIALTADHTTDSNTGSHSADPVPAFIFQPGAGSQVESVNFGETLCKDGNMGRQTGHEFLSRVLQEMCTTVA